MKNNNIELLMEQYKKIELWVHATLDDAMHKVTQEIGELLEAEYLNDIPEMNKEAGDVIVNIASVAYELWCKIENQEKSEEKLVPYKLMMLLSEWNSKVQWFRERYSREDVNLQELQGITSQFISEILHYSEVWIQDILKRSIAKFQSRKDAYIPNIDIADHIDTYSNFPIEDIEFKDISPILRSSKALRYVCFELAKLCQWADKIAALDARGFLFGPKVAELLDIPFEMVRKKWKLPGEVVWKKYGLEYGESEIEIQKKWIQPWEKIALIDDLLATGGTAKAAVDLIEILWAEVMQVAFVIALDEPELQNMPSRKDLWGYNISNIISYE